MDKIKELVNMSNEEKDKMFLHVPINLSFCLISKTQTKERFLRTILENIEQILPL
jgi:hypothetical protein